MACGSSSSGGGGGDGGGGSSGGGSGGGGSGGSSGGTLPASDGGGLTVYGDVHTGEYNLGPVEWTGSYHNSCAPYPDALETIEGDYLAGLDNSFNGDGHLCDACVLMKTAKGKSLVLRVVTTGVSQAATNADLSKAAFDLLTEGEYPRTMTWQLVECPDTGKIQYQYQTGANVYWTSLWVRNARVPIQKVEVMSKNHPTWFELTRGSDGTLTDGGGFGDGTFQIRITSVDGKTVTDSFPNFTPGATVASTQQF
jgi:hypothetical protein